jgi:hypothetical protein
MATDVLGVTVKVGEQREIGSLSVVPLLAVAGEGPAYLTGPEAFEAGLIEVSELDPPQVPSLAVFNLAEVPLLLVEGETLLGGSQNRRMNVTVLCPPKARTIVPVSCVEAGRWGVEQPVSRSRRHSPVSLRAAKTASLAPLAAAGRSRRSDQRRVWEEVASQSMIHGVASKTSALEDVGDALEDRFAEELGELEPLADQIGVAYASGGRVLGLDLFDRPATLAKYLKGIVAGIALDAYAGSTVKGTKESVERFLVEIDRTDRDVAPGVGLGEELRLCGDVVGTGLSFEDILVHLAAFAAPTLVGGMLE